MRALGNCGLKEYENVCAQSERVLLGHRESVIGVNIGSSTRAQNQRNRMSLVGSICEQY